MVSIIKYIVDDVFESRLLKGCTSRHGANRELMRESKNHRRTYFCYVKFSGFRGRTLQLTLATSQPLVVTANENFVGPYRL
jgi:hypothetical protein